MAFVVIIDDYDGSGAPALEISPGLDDRRMLASTTYALILEAVIGTTVMSTTTISLTVDSLPPPPAAPPSPPAAPLATP